MKYDNRIREDLLKILAIRDIEIRELMKAKEKLIEQRDTYEKLIHEIRPYSDCYKRVLKVLKIDRDIIGHVKEIIEQRDELLKVCAAGLVHLEYCHSNHKMDTHDMKEILDTEAMFEQSIKSIKNKKGGG